jgi:crossover junction endodeoxyribonuclease RuvC
VRDVNIIVGIDPGLYGAICFIKDRRGCEILDMPILAIERGGKNKKELDPHLLAEFLSRDIDHAFVEKVGSMPGQGVSSVFSFGTSYGIILGILAAKQIPYTLVPPQRWKKWMKVSASKDSSRSRASQLMPYAANQWPLVKHDGRAEAALIALYGKQIIEHEKND